MPDWLMGVIISSFAMNLLIIGAAVALIIEHRWVRRRRSFDQEDITWPGT